MCPALTHVIGSDIFVVPAVMMQAVVSASLVFTAAAISPTADLIVLSDFGLSQSQWIAGLGNSGTVVSGPEMIQMIYTISRNLPTDGKNEFTLVLLAHHCSCNADVVPGLCLRLE